MTNGADIPTSGFKQMSAAPTTKVLSGAVAGAISVVIVWMLNTFLLPETTQIPGEVASALTTIIAFTAAYFISPTIKDSIVPR